MVIRTLAQVIEIQVRRRRSFPLRFLEKGGENKGERSNEEAEGKGVFYLDLEKMEFAVFGNLIRMLFEFG